MALGARCAVFLAGIILPFLSIAGTVRADESALRVDYDPPRLSVEAREVGLGAVLRAIGAKVGFGVVETVPSSRDVTLSIRDESVDDVLRQLLRARNHTTIYRLTGLPSAGTGPIDRIVLFGDSVTATAAATPPARLTSPQSWPESAAFLIPPAAVGGDPAVMPTTVGEMLQTHAMVAGQVRQPAAIGAGFSAMSQLTPSTSGLKLDAALAETTRRAQQGLGTLIDGLAAATRSLQQSLPPGGK